MIFEMATGSGKTRTAISCVESSLNENNKKIVIISTPQSTLSRQWQKEVTNLLNVFDEMIIVDGTTRWRKELENKLLKINVGVIDNVVIFTTHDTVSSKDFINLIKRNKSKDHSIIFIGDEVHALGSGKRKRALLDIYNERIGLSATPSRWFDDEGTNVLISYFNKCKFEFTIRDALKTINPLTGKTFLSKYYYNPIFVQLIGEEEEKYMELTTKINKNYYLKSKDDENSYLDKLIRDRADIIKNAENKMIALEKLLISIGSQYIKNTIIFVSHSQINKTINILNKLKIRSHKYTQEEGRRAEKKYGGKSERDYIIEMFKKGNLKVLVAMKCLDEGIDIPSADTAILVSSTTNPREYIQRIGRVIRQYDGKNRAHIYDMIVNPSIDSDYDKKIIKRETTRIESIARNAMNNSDVLIKNSNEFGG
jgi:superfamily II DNA or RNA helicase